MNFKLLKSLDHCLGYPLCIIFGVWAELNKLLFKRKLNLSRPRKILILKWFGLGGIIKFSPLLYIIRKEIPETRLIFFTFQSNLKLLELFNCCHEVRIIRAKNPFYFLSDTLKHLLRFGLGEGDIVIDLEFFSKFSTLLAFLSGSPVRMGYHSPSFWRRSLINFPIYLNMHKSLSEAYQATAGCLGIETDDFSLKKVDIPLIKREHMQRILREFGWQDTQYLIGINVNTSEVLLLRRWPAEHFVCLIESLIRKTDFKRWKIVLTGSISEKEYTDSIFFKLSQEARRHVINLAGKLDLELLIALIDILKFLITNDSGPLYLSAMQGIPTISIWGPSSPYFHGGIKGKEHIFCYLNMTCSPCFDDRQPGLSCRGVATCLKNLAPDIVIDHALNLMRNIK